MSPDCLAFCYFSLVSTLASCTTVCANHKFSRTFASKTLIRDQSHQPSSSLLTPRPLSPQLANLPARRNRHTSVCHWHRTQPDQTANLHWESALPQQCSRLGLHCPFRTPVLRPSQQLNSEINPPATCSNPAHHCLSQVLRLCHNLHLSTQTLHLLCPKNSICHSLHLGCPETYKSLFSDLPLLIDLYCPCIQVLLTPLFSFIPTNNNCLQTPSLLGLTKGLCINICPLQAFTRSPC